MYQNYNIYIYIYVCVCVCERERERERERESEREKKWVESDRMYVEKVKRKKNVWWFVYLPTRFDFNLFIFLFFEYKSILSKLF